MNSDNKLYKVDLTKIDFWELKIQKSILAKLQRKIDQDKNYSMAEWEAVEGILNLLDHITDALEENEELKGWKCTDPDNLQYGRQISETVFEFRQYDQHNDTWDNQQIDLEDYTEDEIKEIISAYGYNLEERPENLVIAECIFESEN